jgi:hypothetical protein
MPGRAHIADGTVRHSDHWGLSLLRSRLAVWHASKDPQRPGDDLMFVRTHVRIFDYPRFAEPFRNAFWEDAERLPTEHGIEIEFKCPAYSNASVFTALLINLGYTYQVLPDSTRHGTHHHGPDAKGSRHDPTTWLRPRRVNQLFCPFR